MPLLRKPAPPVHSHRVAPPLPRAAPEVGLPQWRRAWRRAARWVGLYVGTAWTGGLVALLLALGRVPWPEAMAWSLLSGILIGRSAQAGVHRTLTWLLDVRTLELGPSDPRAYRRILEKRLRRYGYCPLVTRLQADTYVPRRGTGVLPPFRVAWSGPGAVIEGPRFLVRSASRLAVG